MTPLVGPISSDVREINIGRHAGAQTVVVVGQSDLHAKDLTNPVLDRLHVARRKFSLPIYLLDRAVKILVRE